MFLKNIINFDKRFFQKIYSVSLKNLCIFPVSYKLFSNNCIKMFLKIIINFDNGFKKTVNGFFFNKPYKNIVVFSYLLILVITKIITYFKN